MNSENDILTPTNTDVNMPVEDTSIQEETKVEKIEKPTTTVTPESPSDTDNSNKDDIAYSKVLYTEEKPTPTNTDVNMPIEEAKETGTSKDDMVYPKVLYNDEKSNQTTIKTEQPNKEIDPEIIYYGCIEKIARDYIETGKMNVSIIPYKVLKQMTDKYKQSGELDTNIDEVQLFINQINNRIEELKNNEQKRTI